MIATIAMVLALVFVILGAVQRDVRLLGVGVFFALAWAALHFGMR
jgi:hypothetical protein